MQKPPSASAGTRHANLKTLAEYLGLSPSTVSFVLNNTPGRSIPESTRARVKAAAEKFNYRPSMVARTLQGKRAQTIGILLPELGEGLPLAGTLRRWRPADAEGLFLLHRPPSPSPRNSSMYTRVYFASRGVDGIVAIDTSRRSSCAPPTVTVAGHTTLSGVANVLIDEDQAARLSLGHLRELGHSRSLSCMDSRSAPTQTRAGTPTSKPPRSLGLSSTKKLMIYLSKDSHSPEISYPGIRKLIKSGHPFTAVLCFNDVSAMGTIRCNSRGRSAGSR